MKPYKDYDATLLKSLRDPVEAAAYLNASLEERDPTLFLLACYNVARAQGMQKVADRAKIHRVSIKKMFSKKGNPEWKSLYRVLAASHLRLKVEAQKRAA